MITIDADDGAVRIELPHGEAATIEGLHPDRQRACSGGRLKLLESLKGPLLAFMDDDIVLASMAAMASLARRAAELGPRLGWVAPFCVNAGGARGFLKDRPHYSPGGIF